MFLSAEKFSFLSFLEKNKETILDNFLSYIHDIETGTLQIKPHLKNCFTEEIVK